MRVPIKRAETFEERLDKAVAEARDPANVVRDPADGRRDKIRVRDPRSDNREFLMLDRKTVEAGWSPATVRATIQRAIARAESAKAPLANLAAEFGRSVPLDPMGILEESTSAGAAAIPDGRIVAAIVGMLEPPKGNDRTVTIQDPRFSNGPILMFDVEEIRDTNQDVAKLRALLLSKIGAPPVSASERDMAKIRARVWTALRDKADIRANCRDCLGGSCAFHA